ASPTWALWGLPRGLLPPRIVGTGMGLLNLGGQLAGAITPLVMGFLVDRFSYTVAFGFMLVGVVASITGALWVPQTTDQFARSAPAGLLQAA
ncbi:MFS transporter, partial [Streptomyces sp. NPDC058964]|uniref:MFS transporter n=1 Tax=Streptomyces sp. NPDC058964 TaxID=3346681 RepID=UPI00367AC1D9